MIKKSNGTIYLINGDYNLELETWELCDAEYVVKDGNVYKYYHEDPEGTAKFDDDSKEWVPIDIKEGHYVGENHAEKNDG